MSEKQMVSFIAERKLLFSEKGSQTKKPMIIKVSSPYTLQHGDVDFPIDGVSSGCYIDFEGLDEKRVDYYGMDAVQALNLASNLDPLIERLSDRYEFFWSTGEPYFEE